MESNKSGNAILSLNEVTKTYQSGKRALTVLSSVSFDVESGQTLSIIGPSGSGKTTLLGLCAGLDQPSSGSIRIADKELANLSEEDRTRIRLEHIGFVFQNFQLIPTLTALENVSIPLELKKATDIRDRAMDWLDRVGLKDRAHHYPVQLSGGEQQRVAIARASVAEPKILFADEPTGNLDGETGAHVEEILFSAHKSTGNTLIIVTHNSELAHKTDRIIALKSGQLVNAS